MKTERVLRLLETAYPSFKFRVICPDTFHVTKKKNNIAMLFIVDGEKDATAILERFKRNLLLEILH